MLLGGGTGVAWGEWLVRHWEWLWRWTGRGWEEWAGGCRGDGGVRSVVSGSWGEVGVLEDGLGWE